ncbi:hypothetical protein EYF80_067014 [Liparis tanakae]|uniref:Uncharacterized protein n=1 Tax=Liparis tanakae TaxID=230148 RepID=A0A4Z2E2W0_9TELE|nr:hypothetical protein EYF80_067014 [Liparis tanakae]
MGTKHSLFRRKRPVEEHYLLLEREEAGAVAIFSELRSIKKNISAGEKERQDLIQVRRRSHMTS